MLISEITLYYARILVSRSLKKLVSFAANSEGQIALYEAYTFARQLEHDYNAFASF